MVASRFTLEKEWALSLVGIPLAVPEYWWPGHKGSKRCRGTIAFVDPLARNQSYFALKLDDAPPDEVYGMKYSAVREYVNRSHPDFTHYHLRLPKVPPNEETDKPAVHARRGSCAPPNQPNFSPRLVSHCKNKRARTAALTPSS